MGLVSKTRGCTSRRLCSAQPLSPPNPLQPRNGAVAHNSPLFEKQLLTCSGSHPFSERIATSIAKRSARFHFVRTPPISNALMPQRRSSLALKKLRYPQLEKTKTTAPSRSCDVSFVSPPPMHSVGQSTFLVFFLRSSIKQAEPFSARSHLPRLVETQTWSYLLSFHFPFCKK